MIVIVRDITVMVIIAAYFQCFPSVRTNTKEVFL